VRLSWESAPFESRVRFVLLGILLASLLLQGSSALVLDRARNAMEVELLSPLHESLDRMEIRGTRDPIPFDGVFRFREGLAQYERFRLRDTVAHTVRAAWLRLPPNARDRLINRETVRIGRTSEGRFDIQLARCIGHGDQAQIVSVNRAFPEYGKLMALERWTTGTRAVGLSLLLVAVFLVTRELARPFKRLKRVVADAQERLHWDVPASREEWDDIIQTFAATIERLKADEAKLQEQYVTSEEARQHLDLLNQKIIDAIPSALIALDAEGRIVRWNPAAEDLPGLPKPITRMPFEEFVLPWAPVEELLRGAGAPGNEFDIMRDGERHHYSLRRVPVSDGGSVLLLDDHTQLRRLEALLAQRARLAALGETAAGLAHELRNAMGTILGYAKLMIRSGDRNTTEIATGIEQEAAGMEEMLKRFLEVARPTEPRPAPTVVAELIEEVLSRYEERLHDAGLSVVRCFDEDATFELDPFWLRQALGNLIENAIQVVPAQGSVRVTATVGPSECRITVADSGPGVAPEWRDKILAPFVSLRAGGTGLGLALVQKVMTAHGGRVEVSQAPEGGAQFDLILPAMSLPHTRAAGVTRTIARS